MSRRRRVWTAQGWKEVLDVMKERSAMDNQVPADTPRLITSRPRPPRGSRETGLPGSSLEAPDDLGVQLMRDAVPRRGARPTMPAGLGAQSLMFPEKSGEGVADSEPFGLFRCNCLLTRLLPLKSCRRPLRRSHAGQPGSGSVSRSNLLATSFRTLRRVQVEFGFEPGETGRARSPATAHGSPHQRRRRSLQNAQHRARCRGSQPRGSSAR